MNPVKPDEIYDIISKKLDINKNDISEINKFFWKHVKSNLTTLHSPSLYISGLGRFTLKQNKIFPTIEKYRNNVKYWREKAPQNPITIDYSKDYKILSNMGNILKEEWSRKKEYRNGRK